MAENPKIDRNYDPDTLFSYVNQLKQKSAEFELIKAYAQINDAARNGESITAADFNVPEKNFNEQMTAIKADKKRWNSLSGTSGTAEKLSAAESLQAEYNSLRYLESEEHKQQLKKLKETIHNTAPLDDAFRRDYVATAPKKNTEISATTDTPQKLLIELLSKNNGVAIGEFHTSNSASDIITNNMALLKKNKVDTIYMEMSDKKFQYLNNSSSQALSDDLKKHKSGNNPAKNALYAEFYGTKYSDDRTEGVTKLFIAAKEQGIRIINIDKIGDARMTEIDIASIRHRFSSTNYTWFDKINLDHSTQPPDSKYITGLCS